MEFLNIVCFNTIFTVTGVQRPKPEGWSTREQFLGKSGENAENEFAG